jgi:hypothetical protein
MHAVRRLTEDWEQRLFAQVADVARRQSCDPCPCPLADPFAIALREQWRDTGDGFYQYTNIDARHARRGT